MPFELTDPNKEQTGQTEPQQPAAQRTGQFQLSSPGQQQQPVQSGRFVIDNPASALPPANWRDYVAEDAGDRQADKSPSWGEVVSSEMSNWPKRLEQVYLGTLASLRTDAHDPDGLNKLLNPFKGYAAESRNFSRALRKDPDNQHLRSYAQRIGVDPDKILSGDWREQLDENHKLNQAFRTIGMANDPALQENLARAQQIEAEMQENHLDLPTWSAKGLARDALVGVQDMIPAIGVGLLTRSPATASAAMGGTVYGRTYLETLQQMELPHEEAKQRAGMFMLLEGATEAVPLKTILSGGGGYLKKILKSAAQEGVQEAVMETLQTGYDYLALDEDITLGDFLENVAHSAVVGSMVGGTLAAAVPGGIPPEDIPDQTGADQGAAGAPDSGAAPQDPPQPPPGSPAALNVLEMPEPMEVGNDDGVVFDPETGEVIGGRFEQNIPDTDSPYADIAVDEITNFDRHGRKIDAIDNAPQDPADADALLDYEFDQYEPESEFHERVLMDLVVDAQALGVDNQAVMDILSNNEDSPSSAAQALRDAIVGVAYEEGGRKPSDARSAATAGPAQTQEQPGRGRTPEDPPKPARQPAQTGVAPTERVGENISMPYGLRLQNMPDGRFAVNVDKQPDNFKQLSAIARKNGGRYLRSENVSEAPKFVFTDAQKRNQFAKIIADLDADSQARAEASAGQEDMLAPKSKPAPQSQKPYAEVTKPDIDAFNAEFKPTGIKGLDVAEQQDFIQGYRAAAFGLLTPEQAQQAAAEGYTELAKGITRGAKVTGKFSDSPLSQTELDAAKTHVLNQIEARAQLRQRIKNEKEGEDTLEARVRRQDEEAIQNAAQAQREQARTQPAWKTDRDIWVDEMLQAGTLPPDAPLPKGSPIGNALVIDEKGSTIKTPRWNKVPESERRAQLERHHQQRVEQAVADGEYVPDSTRAAYPDLFDSEQSADTSPAAEPVKWFGAEAKATAWIDKQSDPTQYRVEKQGRRFNVFETEQDAQNLPPTDSLALTPEGEKNLPAAKALLKEQRNAAGDKKKESDIRRRARALAKSTPATDAQTVMTLDMIATRLNMNEQGSRYKDLEFSEPAEKPAPKKHSNTNKEKAGPQEPPKRESGYGKTNKVFTESAAEKARRILREKMNNLNAGLDPETLQAGITLAGYHIEAGARSFGAYSKAMIDDLGQNIKPYLRSFYEAVRHYPEFDTTGMDTSAEVDAAIKAEGRDPNVTDDGEIRPVAAKPKAVKSTGRGQVTLKQDFGVDRIDGYNDQGLDSGNEVKAEFKRNTLSYLRQVSKALAAAGYGAKGKAVSFNEAGPAVSGDGSLIMQNPETGVNAYVSIGDTALRGVVPATEQGISVMYRVSLAEGDTQAIKGTNLWAPTDLTAAELAQLITDAANNAAARGQAKTNRVTTEILTAPEHAGNKGKPLQLDEKYQPVATGESRQTDVVDEGLFSDPDIQQHNITADQFKEVIDEWALQFENPEKRTVTSKRVDEQGGYIDPKEAAKRVEQWKARVQQQFDENRGENSNKTVLSLFDLTGEWSKPYREAGYNVITFDIQTGQDIMDFSVEYFNENWDFGEVYAILAASPCTDFASSGARWFADKDADGRTEASKELVFQTMRTIEYFRPQVWALENPVGRIKNLTGLPEARLTFDPNHFGSPYTKKTMLYGNFNPDLPLAPVEPTEGSKMHQKYGGKSQATKNARSETPEGFAYAFFMANNAVDTPAIDAMPNQYPLAAGAIRAALEAGVPVEQVQSILEETYENFEYEDARNELAKATIAQKKTPAPAEPAAVEGEVVSAAEQAFADFANSPAYEAFYVFQAVQNKTIPVKEVPVTDDPIDGLSIFGNRYSAASSMKDAQEKALAQLARSKGDRSTGAALRLNDNQVAWMDPQGTFWMPDTDNLSEYQDTPPVGEVGDLFSQPPQEQQNDVSNDNQRDNQRTRPETTRDDGAKSEPGKGAERVQSEGGQERKRSSARRAQRSRAEELTGTAGERSHVHGGKKRRGSRAESDNRGSTLALRSNYRITDRDQLGSGGAISKARSNIESIKILLDIQKTGRDPSHQELQTLVKYVGWGASDLANKLFPAKGEPTGTWKELRDELKSLLSKEDYDTAARSTQYAHYTSKQVIDSIWQAVSNMGLKSGLAFEGGLGTGNFIGLIPPSMNLNYAGVEMDGITAGIAKVLYPESGIMKRDFTKLALPEDYYDLTIGNPPFSRTVIANDPKYRKHKFKLHDYFIAKQLDSLRPGGIAVFVTSKGTMDKGDASARQYIADRADLLGAIRLPQTAFKENAGTEVVTDILFFKKREEGAEAEGPAWMDVKEIKTPDGAAFINEYFADNKQMILGESRLEGSMYRANEYTVVPTGDIVAQLAQAIDRLPKNVYTMDAMSDEQIREKIRQIELDPKGTEGSYYIDEAGALRQVSVGVGEVVPVRGGDVRSGMSKKQAEIITDYVGLRDAVLDVFAKQDDEPALKKAQKVMEKQYDAFVKKHGPINQTRTINRKDGLEITSEPVLDTVYLDPYAYQVAMIENYDEESGEATKGRVFSEKVRSTETKRQIESAVDALSVTLNDKGQVDLDYLAELYNTTPESALAELDTAVYQDPGTDRFVTEDEYLSGNVKAKLAAATEAAKTDPKYNRNVKALKNVQPEDKPLSKIPINLGAMWVPADVVQSFAEEVLDFKGNISSFIRGETSNWDVNGKSDNLQFATDRRKAHEILGAALNRSTIQIYDEIWVDGNKTREINKSETAAANNKVSELRDAFYAWALKDEKASESLFTVYNERFNTTVPRKFNGSHLTLPRLSPRYKPHPWQLNAVWRIITTGNTYVAHTVGAGKTLTSAIAAIELKRLGLARKPTFSVLKSTLKQFAVEFLDAFPDAKVLVADERQLDRKNLRKFYAKMRSDDWDAVVLSHQAFEKIALSDEYISDFVESELDEYRALLESVNEEDRAARKKIEQQIEQMEQRLEGMTSAERKIGGMSFEETGIDFLFVDEAHNHKKIPFPTNQANLKGVDPNGSNIAYDLYLKSQYLNQIRPKRNLVLMSGTPVTNTVGELFNIQRYLQPDVLESGFVSSFDAWSATFTETVTELEMQASGNFKPSTRLARFVGVPALLRDFLQVADIISDGDLSKSISIKRPAVRGGQRQIVAVERAPEMVEYQSTLAKRISAIENRKGPPKKGDDIVPVVIMDAKKASIDMRLVGRHQSVPSKLDVMIDRIYEGWQETRALEYKSGGRVEQIKGATQLVFTELRASAGFDFDVYLHIKDSLARKGVPEGEIAFIQDYNTTKKKKRLFREMNTGQKTILLGGSKNLGTGTNVQQRLYNIHHLDIDYLPANIVQREGRAIRQGNKNPDVGLFAYATSGTVDAFMWQLNETKQKMIDQVMGGDLSIDSFEDISDNASQMAMAKALASGNPLLLEMAGLTAEVTKLRALRDAHINQKFTSRKTVQRMTLALQMMEQQREHMLKIAEKYTPSTGDKFVMELAGKKFTERKKAGDFIIGSGESLTSRDALTIAGITAKVKRETGNAKNIGFEFYENAITGADHLLMWPNTTISVDVDTDPVGVIKRLENLARKISELPPLIEEEMRVAERKRELASAQQLTEFQYDDDLKLKEKRLLEIDSELESSNTTPDAEPDVDQPGVVNEARPAYRTTREKIANRQDGNTAAFKRWFADSKVVDEAGRPLVVYHGTNATFTTFDKTMQGSNTGWENTNLGFYFIADRNLAKDFAKENGQGEIIVDAYLSIQKPLRLITQDLFNNAEQAPTIYEAMTGQRLSEQEALAAINDEVGLGEIADVMEAIASDEGKAIVTRDGYDGVFSSFGDGNTEYVAFEPTQIKSATANAGAYNPDTPSIVSAPRGSYAASAADVAAGSARPVNRAEMLAQEIRELTEQVDQLYEAENFDTAERLDVLLDARMDELENLLDALDEWEGFTEGDDWNAYGAMMDDKLDLETQLSSLYKEVFIDNWRTMDEDAAITNIRSNLADEFGADAIKGMPDTEVLAIARGAYDARQGYIDKKREARRDRYDPMPAPMNFRQRNAVVGVQEAHARLDTSDTIRTAPAAVMQHQARSAYNDLWVQTETGSVRIGVEKVTSPEEAAHVFAPYRKHGAETVLALITDKDHRPLAVVRHSKGTSNASMINPLEFVGAMMSIDNGVNVWLGHNHPSGRTVPSQADRDITSALTDILQGSPLTLHEHIILGAGASFTSFTDISTVGMRRIKPARRDRTIPVTEKTVRRRTSAYAKPITDSDMAVEAVLGVDADNVVVLLNTQYVVLGHVVMTHAEMRNLKSTRAAGRLASAIHDTNAAAILIKTDNYDDGFYGAMNVVSAGTAGNISVLDWIYKAPNGKYVSHQAETGWRPNPRERSFQSVANNPPNAKAIDVDAVNAAVMPIMQQWRSAPALAIVESAAQLPAAVKYSLGDVSGPINGHYDAVSDTVYLVADQITNAEQAVEVLRHEVIGHFAFERQFGDKLGKIIDDIDLLSTTNDKVRRIAQQVEKDYPRTTKRQKTAEIIAQLSEKQIRFPGFVKFRAAIRQLLRRLGLPIKTSLVELQAMIAKAAASLSARHADIHKTDSVQEDKPVYRTEAEARAETGAAIRDARTFDKLKTAGWKLTDFRRAGLYFLGRNHLVELGSKIMPSMKPYLSLAKRMDAFRNHLLAEHSVKADRWRSWAQKNRAENQQLMDLIHDATVAGVDPAAKYSPITTQEQADKKIAALKEKARGRSGENTARWMDLINKEKAKVSQEAERQQAAPALYARWEKLSDEAKGIYVMARDSYRDHQQEVMTALVERIQESVTNERYRSALIDAVRMQFEQSQVVPPYFPLSRFGEYWVKVTNGEEYTFHMFESAPAQQAFVKTAEKEGIGNVSWGKKMENLRQFSGVAPAFMTEVQGLLDQLGDGPTVSKVKDEVYQLYLTSLPDLSSRKHFIHRGSIEGYSGDAIRAFSHYMFHGSYQLARLKYAHRMETVMEEMIRDLSVVSSEDAWQELIEDAKAGEPGAARRIKNVLAARQNPNTASDYLNELQKRHEWAMNPTGGKLAQWLTSVGFAFYLGVSPAAAMVNLSQTAVAAYPILGARYGSDKAFKQLYRTGTEFFRSRPKGEAYSISNTLKGEELAAFNALQDSGILDKTLGHDLAGMADQGFEYNSVAHRVMGVVSWQFHHAERYNREVTAMAAYRLARAAGSKPLEAVQAAGELTEMAHFDYSSANKARVMQSDTARVLLLFRQFSLNMTYLLARTTYLSLGGESKEVKRIARRQIAGILGMTAIMAGTTGLPLWWMVAFVFNTLFDDEDEPFMFSAEYRRWLAETTGSQTIGSMIANGPMNTLTGASISTRVSLNNLWLREPNRDLEGRDAYQYWLEQVAGPVGGMAGGVFSFGSLLSDGQYKRAFEQLMPVFVRNQIKTYRFAEEGATNMRGDPIIEDLTPWELTVQSIGFTPARLNDRYLENNAVKRMESKILARRAQLMDRFALAFRLGDDEAQEKALDMMERFNEYNPTVPITNDSLTQSIESRAGYSDRATQGIIVNKNLQNLLDEYDFAN